MARSHSSYLRDARTAGLRDLQYGHCRHIRQAHPPLQMLDLHDKEQHNIKTKPAMMSAGPSVESRPFRPSYPVCYRHLLTAHPSKFILVGVMHVTVLAAHKLMNDLGRV